MAKRQSSLEPSRKAIVFALAAFAMAALGAPGYLPTVGPAPLRFQCREPPRPAVVLPPLLVHAPDPAPSNAPTAEVTVSRTETRVGPPVPGPTQAPESAQGVSVFVPGMMPPTLSGQDGPDRGVGLLAPITPQMLLEYLRPVGTNTATGVISLPVFVPPMPPVASRSSKATYTTP